MIIWGIATIVTLIKQSENKTESSLVSSLLKHGSLSLDKRFGEINKKSNSPNDDNE